MKNLGIGSRVEHPAYGVGVVVRIHKAAYDISFVQYGMKMVGRDYAKFKVIEAVESDEKVTFDDFEKSLVKVLRSFSDINEVVELGDKWKDGTLILKPGEAGLKSKELPIDAFFHKIVMVRDRLRVMEQKINASGLTDEEKVNLEQYITRIYGSLTTFNVLFKYKADHLVGDRS